MAIGDRPRRPGLVTTVIAAAVVVAVTSMIAWPTLFSGPPPAPAPSSEPPTVDPVGPLTVGVPVAGQIAPGFADTASWQIDLRDGAKVAGTPLGLVEVAGNRLRLYGAGTGAALFEVKLTDPVLSLAAGRDGSTEVLAWLSGGELHWWSMGESVQAAPADWASDLSASGGRVLVAGGTRTATLAGGKLVEFRLPSGRGILGVTARGVVAADSDGLYLLDPATQLSRPIDLRPPTLGYRPVRWAGLAAGFAVVVWSPVANPAPGQPVTVALHNFDGRVMGHSDMPFQVASSATWLRTMGQQVGTFATVGFALVDGTVMVECDGCTLSGGFGPLVAAAQGGVTGLWRNGTLVPSTVEIVAATSGYLLVRDGSTVYGYPAV